MVRRTNKMITLTIPEMDYIDAHLKGKFSKFVSRSLVNHMSDLKLAQDMSSRQLLGIVQARLYSDEKSFNLASESEAFKLLQRLLEIS